MLKIICNARPQNDIAEGIPDFGGSSIFDIHRCVILGNFSNLQTKYNISFFKKKVFILLRLVKQINFMEQTLHLEESKVLKMLHIFDEFSLENCSNV